MNNKNELNDIILNKGGANSSSKKIILAIATLGVILIIVVLVMNYVSDDDPISFEEQERQEQKVKEENFIPDFTEDVDFMAPQKIDEKPHTDEKPNEEFSHIEGIDEVEELAQDDDINLQAITQKIKEDEQGKESVKPVVSSTVIEEPTKIVISQAPKVPTKPKAPHTIKKTHKKPFVKAPLASTTTKYYIQVGSFTKYSPSKKLLKSIKNLGYGYKFHQVKQNAQIVNKVLVGPFKNQAKAKDARRIIRAKIEPGAFLVKLH